VNKIRLPLARPISTSRSTPWPSRTCASLRLRLASSSTRSSPALGHTEQKRGFWTANVVYTFRDQVRNEMLPINPLGLTITYFREDQAFRD